MKKLNAKGHYVGPHSDQHLLYAPWENRDSLLLSKSEFEADLMANIQKLKAIGVTEINKFVAPYEWYNKQIAEWSNDLGLELYNFTHRLKDCS
ncbi:polysaccharide deacetylase family protein [Sphingobacterium daejeonense]|uniref:polysaccharide deacetylase family protein n=1 Tax=Sphingobacterium daejeonense TaxID=371142 RepID=UPI0010C26F67|nr:polysaccharide deacetylase family protein [Sphingobacterium daejeonense]VTP88071.1 Uncharacterised protein [Sphingobacterium daejeonense]